MQSSTSILQLKVTEESIDELTSLFTILPLNRGYGHTMGNSLRRVMLSSMRGAAITTAKFEGADHEFTTIKGVYNSVNDMLLILKQIRFKLPHDVSSASFFIEVDSSSGTREVTSNDIQTTNSVEVITKNLHITSVTNANFVVEGTIEAGYGYLPSEEMSSEEIPTGYIRVDAFFSPVRKVSYSVENTRVGQATDLDMLKLEVATDGTVTPKAVLLSSISTLSEIGSKISQSLNSSSVSVVSSGSEKAQSGKPSNGSVESTSSVDSSADLSVLELSNRTLNVLKSNGIYTLGNLTNVKLSSIAGAGQKAKEEIRSKAEKFNLTIKE